MNDNSQSDALEKQHQASIDFFKHLSTLCSGAVLITVTVYEKLKALSPDLQCIKASVGLFLLCLLCSLVGHFLIVTSFGTTPSNTIQKWIGFASVVASISFFVAVLSFALFAIRL